MNCPNCNKEMKDKSYWYYGISDWDMDYPATLHKEYCCLDCGIEFVGSSWIIPPKYELATDKQKNCVKFINRELGMNFNPLLKRNSWEFINSYLDDARQSRDTKFECWCEDNSDWLPEYF